MTRGTDTGQQSLSLRLGRCNSQRAGLHESARDPFAHDYASDLINGAIRLLSGA